MFSGGDAQNVALGAQISKSGYENNYLKHDQITQMGKELEACKQQGLGACETLLKSYKELSDENREAMLACDTVECWQKARAGMDGGLDGLKELVAA